MNKAELIATAKRIAAQQQLDPALVCAVCHHESGGWNTWASRYEPAFFEKYVPIDSKTFGRVCSRDTEKRLRATSFGLMQIMGQVARERGFEGEYLTELCDPEVGIEYGCRELARRLKNAGGDVRKGLLGYNGGGNRKYPDLVLEHYEEYQ
jgi:soluble lytic murein transglycosylase-like protein